MVSPRAVARGPRAPAAVARAPIDASDEELVSRARSGDGWAEEALFRRHVDYIAALALRLLRDPYEAEEVVQETFLAALTRLRTSAPVTLRSWLAGIAVHKAHRRFRRRKLLSLLGLYRSSHDAVLEAHAHASTSPELRAELGLLDAALAQVADVDRAAWMLRYFDGYTLGEVADLCRCSQATAKRRIRRAQEIVRVHAEVEEVDDV
jgi:RNA polymerase sigma-70 factor, ECF subfamily